jgi:hypothetical protein
MKPTGYSRCNGMTLWKAVQFEIAKTYSILQLGFDYEYNMQNLSIQPADAYTMAPCLSSIIRRSRFAITWMLKPYIVIDEDASVMNAPRTFQGGEICYECR